MRAALSKIPCECYCRLEVLCFVVVVMWHSSVTIDFSTTRSLISQFLKVFIIKVCIWALFQESWNLFFPGHCALGMCKCFSCNTEMVLSTAVSVASLQCCHDLISNTYIEHSFCKLYIGIINLNFLHSVLLNAVWEICFTSNLLLICSQFFLSCLIGVSITPWHSVLY